MLCSGARHIGVRKKSLKSRPILIGAVNLNATPARYDTSAAVQSPRMACQRTIAAIAAVSARKMRGPKETGTTFAVERSRARSSGENPPSGPINTAHAPRGDKRRPPLHACGVADKRSSADPALPCSPPQSWPGSSPASSQNIRVRSLGQVSSSASNFCGPAMAGTIQSPGLLGGFNSDGVKASEVYPILVGSMGQEQTHPRGAQFDRLLDNGLQTRSLDHRDDQLEIRREALGAGSGLDEKRRGSLGGRRYGRSPLPPSRPLKTISASPIWHRITVRR